MKIIITAILANIIFLVSGQNGYIEYYRLMRMAKKYELQNKLDSSLICYKDGFSKVDFIHEKYLISAIKLSKKLEQKELENKLSFKYTNQKDSINKVYASEIEQLIKTDQENRCKSNLKAQNKYKECVEKGNCNQEELEKYKLILSKWHYIDSMNIEKLLFLIKAKGFPSEKLVGKVASEHAVILMIHFDTDTNNYILKPILDKALRKGYILPSNYAWIIDRRLVNRGKLPYFYKIPFGIENLTIDKKIEVDKRREKIGLGKLCETQIVVKKKNYYKVKYIE